MKYVKLDMIEKPVSRLVYGTPGIAADGDEARALECYEMAYQMGFRVFDTAHSYGHGEEMLGKWLVKYGHREDIAILDKGCNPRAKYMEPDVFCADTIRKQVAESQERLQTDFVELYILHRDDPDKPVDEIVEVLNELKAAGKIGCFGGSNWSMERLQAANAYASAHGLEGFTVCSPNYTYAKTVNDPWGGSVTATGPENQPFRDYLTENQMPVFNYSSLGRGFYSGRYHSDNRKPIAECIAEGPILEYYVPENVECLRRAEIVAEELGATVSQVVLAWLLHQPMNLFPITMPTSEAHMREAVEALDMELSEAQLSFLGAAL